MISGTGLGVEFAARLDDTTVNALLVTRNGPVAHLARTLAKTYPTQKLLRRGCTTVLQVRFMFLIYDSSYDNTFNYIMYAGKVLKVGFRRCYY